MAVYRSFVALEISDEVGRAVHRVQEELKGAGARVGWIAPGNVHLTLHFLGDVLEEAVPALAAGLDAGAHRVPGFKFQVSGVGFFGPPHAPRIIWAGLPLCPPELSLIYAETAKVVEASGFKVDVRPFHPHITIGRIRSAFLVRELTSLVDGHKDTRFGEVGVRRLLLMRSHLDEPKARYSILHESPLKGT